jgi:hypothetical protein
MYFFTFNPSPAAINPGLYFILIGINLFCLLWTIVLFVIGTKISFGVSYFRAFWGSLTSIVIAGFLCMWGMSAALNRFF